ncbi:MAG: glycosyltransferase family 9 protein [Candidatus Omnitrophica bacterium]|nr:glycosyltransferase family 9 protein [Candidatus Omnitrophota bacterium]MDD5652653.1 glycosyltransferase family 9 protein [Candidatus Omnitrophota bacterium]
MQIDQSKVKNILVVRNDRFGEFLLNIPAFRALRESFSSARIIAAVDPAVKELALSVPYLDETFPWEGKKHSLSEKLRLAGQLKAKKIDIAIMLNPSQEFNLVCFLAGIPVRAGYNRKWGFLLNRKIPDKKALGLKHEVEYNLELAQAIGAKTADKSIKLNIAQSLAQELVLAARLDEQKDFVVLHPWSSDPVKLWPREKFSELAELLAEELKLKVVVVGAVKNPAFPAISGSTLIDLTGKTTLTQLALILKRAKLLVSADSGPVHLACAVGCPVIALFRNDLPGKTAKRWGPRGEKTKIIESNNLAQISAQEVFLTVKEILKR